MLNFDKEFFLSVTNGAVNLRGQIEQIVEEVSEKGYKNIFLVGAGGTIALMYPLEYILKTKSEIPVYAEIAKEFLVMEHKRFDENSLFITASLSGTTEDTIAAIEFAKEKGATTISLVGNFNTPIEQLTDYTIVNPANNPTECESMHIQLYQLIYGLMNKRGEFPEYAEFMEELPQLPNTLVKVKEASDRFFEDFALKYKDETYHMIVGSGNLWGETYLFSMCVLEECQWIRTKSIHAAEFFHGTIELVEEDTSVMLFKGEDATRPLMERVENFVNRYSNKVTVVDTKNFELNGISEKFRADLSPIILATSLERLAIHLEEKRNHSLDTRRYYRVVQY
ncbi:SIS domain-containing protein [Priestia aryabhattai]|uniref:SIS domain-containing protein n=1 Tax=Priestia aryabhattai TaxID=412384 RepID=UPI0039823A2D